MASLDMNLPSKRDRYRNKWYQIAPQEFSRLLAEQKNCFALCRSPFGTERRNQPHVDHSHDCPTMGFAHHLCKIEAGCPECVRGLLCLKCNVFLVPVLELHPERQTETDKAYLTDRPIRRYQEEFESQFPDSWAPGDEWIDVWREHQAIFREVSVAKAVARV